MIERIRSVASTIHPDPLGPDDAERICAIAQLVVDLDGKEASAEIESYFAVGKFLYELAGQPGASIPTFASDEEDEERMFELATEVKSTPARELAFIIARALASVDHQADVPENTFLDRLRGVLAIPKWRADELAMLLRAVA